MSYLHVNGATVSSPLQQPGRSHGDWPSQPCQDHRWGTPEQQFYAAIPVQQNGPPAGLEAPLESLPPSAAGRRKRHWVRNTLLGLAGLFVLLIVIGIAAGPPTQAPPTAGTAPGAAAPAQAPLHAAPAPAAPSPAAQIKDWYVGGGSGVIDAITKDFGDIGTAGTNEDPAAMNTACSSLRTDTEAAQAYAPIPDTQAQTNWAAGLAREARASTDCIAGLSSHNDSLISQAGQEIQAGNSDIARVAARITALSH
jgi:hypothetical protein